MMVPLVMSLAILGQEIQPIEVASAPAWHGPVSKIIRTRCANCHAADSVGPFPLLEYDQVRRRATFIRHVIEEGLMPPWLPTGGVALRHDRGLSTEERELLLSWLDGGALEGDVVDESAAPPAAPSIASPADSPVEVVDQGEGMHRASMRGTWDIPAEGGRRWF